VNLLYDCDAACDNKVDGHPQNVMQTLGITYQYATPQSICDCWQFWNCKGVMDILPPYLSKLETDPHEMVGFGLTKEMADEIEEDRR
jgi:hypothetical protein